MKRADFTVLPRGYTADGPTWFLRKPAGRHPDTIPFGMILDLCRYGPRLELTASMDGWRIDVSQLAEAERGQLRSLLGALVKKDGECRWGAETNAIPAEQLAPHLDAVDASTGLEIVRLKKRGRFDLRNLGNARGLLLLILDRAISWPVVSEQDRGGGDGDLERALQAARSAIARQRSSHVTAEPKQREDAMSGWLALESGDRQRALSIIGVLDDPDESRPLRIALSWLERDELALTATIRQVLAAGSLHRGRLDGARGEALCWDGFIRLAVTDAGALWGDSAWLSGCQLQFGAMSFDETERAVLQRGRAAGNPRPIQAACGLLSLWDAALRARAARMTGEVAEELEAELPSLSEIDALVLPGPLRSAADALAELRPQAPPAEAEKAPLPLTTRVVVTRDEKPHRAAIERGETEHWRFVLPDAPEEALARAAEDVVALSDRWSPDERRRAFCGMFLLACAAERWEQASEYLPDVLRGWRALVDTRAWEESVWLYIENLPWDSPDNGKAVKRETVSGTQASRGIIECLETWNDLVDTPLATAPTAIERLAVVEGHGLPINGIRQRLCRWWLSRLSMDDVEDPGIVNALVSAFQLIGDEVPPDGRLEARCLYNAALLMEVEKATAIAEEWLGRWQGRLEVSTVNGIVLSEWHLFSPELARLWVEQVLGERAFWAWIDCSLLEFDVHGTADALSTCARVFRETSARLGLASRMLDLLERFVDRLESPVELGVVCATTADWLRGTQAPPAARPYCRLLLDLVKRVGRDIGLELPDLENLAGRFGEVPRQRVADYLPASGLLKGKSVVVVGGRPSTFVQVREMLSDEDGAVVAAHVPTGEGTGPRGDAAAAADWILLVTTYLGHDDSASIEARVRRRGGQGRIVRLPDRRDGAHTIVQLLRRTAAVSR